MAMEIANGLVFRFSISADVHCASLHLITKILGVVFSINSFANTMLYMDNEHVKLRMYKRPHSLLSESCCPYFYVVIREWLKTSNRKTLLFPGTNII